MVQTFQKREDKWNGKGGRSKNGKGSGKGNWNSKGGKGKGKGNSSNKGGKGKGKPYSKQNYQKGEYVKVSNLKRVFEELRKEVIEIDNNDGNKDKDEFNPHHIPKKRKAKQFNALVKKML